VNFENIFVKTISFNLKWLHCYGELKMCVFGPPCICW